MGAPVDAVGVSARRAELAGNKVGWRGLVSSKKTFGIALFASLGGLVYGCTWYLPRLYAPVSGLTNADNQGMFAQILTMSSFIKAVRTLIPVASTI